jgi:GNAT superfamily N-acetyltransferase
MRQQGHLQTQLVPAESVLSLRTRHREEMNCQIVHDSIHRRPGWTVTYRLDAGGNIVGFGSVAVAGPWKNQPTLLEFYLLPEHRGHAFALFETLLAAAKPQRFEIQSNDVLPFIMAHTYGRDIASEKIVFRDAVISTLPNNGVLLRRTTSDADDRRCQEQRSGSSDWTLELNGVAIGRGGFAFHYNLPYADVYMEIDEPYRQRGFGSYFVQELKRECYERGAVPAARCSPENAASFRTLQRAGFVPFAHILIGAFHRQGNAGI